MFLTVYSHRSANSNPCVPIIFYVLIYCQEHRLSQGTWVTHP